MAALSFNASFSQSAIVRGRTSRIVLISNHAKAKLQNSFAIAPSSIRPNDRTAPRVLALPSRRRKFNSLCVASVGDAAQIEPPPRQNQSQMEEEKDVVELTAIPVVMEFYQAINRNEITALSDQLAENCVLNDSQFPKAFEGRKVVLKFMDDLMEAMGKGIKFTIDGIGEGDGLNVALLWHLEWEGKALPFTKGCSFCYCEKHGEKLLIRYIQNFIEPPIKPGEMILQLLKIISSLLEKFPLVAQSII